MKTIPDSEFPTDPLACRRVEASETWRLTSADKLLIEAKSRSNRLSFALLLLFFREYGRFPRTPEETKPDTVSDVARQLGIGLESARSPALSGRTTERHHAEIRTLLGFREVTTSDGEAMTEWLRDHAVVESRDIKQLTEELEQRCRVLKIEPPAIDRIERIVRAALHAYDERFCQEIHGRLSLATRTKLNALLNPTTKEPMAAASDETDRHTPAVLIFVCSDPGQPSVNSLQTELAKLELIRTLGLPPGLFDQTRPHELERFCRQVAVEAPYELRRHAEPYRLTALAAPPFLSR